MTDERSLVREAVRLIEDRKGEDVVVIDLSDVSIPTSYFVVVGADNTAHAKALINALRKGLPVKPSRSEGVSTTATSSCTSSRRMHASSTTSSRCGPTISSISIP